jgi:phosphatidylglycerophosphatase A
VKRLLIIIATFFYVGRIPVAPGTFTSLATMLLMYYVEPYRNAPVYIHLLLICVVFVVGIPASRYSEKYFGKKDPGQCTIDEVAGQMIALLFVPPTLKLYIAGFVLFRIFDILKPFPIRALEKPPHGVGIMLDDVAAGLYALGAIHLGMFIIKQLGYASILI